MLNAMYTDSALLDTHATDVERLWQYKRFAVALTYPDEQVGTCFPQVAANILELACEYDRLFRAQEIWLYGAEYLAENEFHRAQLLADIAGFYRAFGVAPVAERPDALACELEFMHYLIYKQLYALTSNTLTDVTDKAAICFDAQQKFFAEHLYPAAQRVARAIWAQSAHPFYRQMAAELLEFLETEATRLMTPREERINA